MMENKIWVNGEIMEYGKFGVPLLTHSLQYGTGIFEGIRSYETQEGSAIFRLKDHVERFFRTAATYHMKLGFSMEAISEGIREVVRVNGFRSCYIRPFAYYDSDQISLSTAGKKVSVAIAAVPFGQYFGDKLSKGISCKVSSWRRINSEILPVQAKASGNYLNSIIASMDADGTEFDEVILLSGRGHVAEGPGENIFLVRDGRLLTPGVESDILLGITRESIIELAGKMGIDVVEREIHREELYSADELFFCGTAAEITPITNVDGVTIGNGKVGQMTSRLQKKFFDIVSGRDAEFKKWLTPA